MASINLQQGKCNMAKALYGIPKHNYRTGKNHSNKDIDPTRSHLNKHYGPQTAQEFRDRFREMVSAMDEKHPPKRLKKDRKVLLMMDTPSPREGMSQEDEARWGAKVHEVMCELFPGDVVGSTYHADELHKYTPKGEKERKHSRGHTHTAVLPWTEEWGLNMDKFYDFKKKDLPNRINEALDKACMEMFGFPYRDGTGQKSKGTVEKLKLESEIAERENKLEQVEADLSNKLFDVQEAQEALQDVENKKMDAESELEALRGECEALEGKYKDLEAQTATTKEELAKAQSAFSRFMEKVSAWVESHHGLERILRVAIRLSDTNRAKIEKKMEKTVEQGGKAILEATESVEGLLAAEDELERGKRTFDSLRTAVKEDIDIDELDGMEL